jgi:hypothetical protein
MGRVYENCPIIEAVCEFRTETRKQVASLMASRATPELPDVFNLRPLSSQPVTVMIQKAEPARFYFVEEEDWLDDAQA